MRSLRLQGQPLVNPNLSPLPRSSCLQAQTRRQPMRGYVRPACLFGIGRREEKQQYIQTIEPGPELPPERPAKREMTYIVGLFVLAVAFGIKRWRYMRSRRAEEEYEKRRWGQAKPVADMEYPQSGLDSKEFQLALARTRQAMHVHKAASFMNTANSARSLVELQRAMQENSIARCPVLKPQHDDSTMNDLYRLYVSNTEMPAKYSTLLQLRELLDIKEDQAESLEQEVLGSSSSFSI